MKKRMLREGEQVFRRRGACEWWSQAPNPGCLAKHTMYFTTALCCRVTHKFMFPVLISLRSIPGCSSELLRYPFCYFKSFKWNMFKTTFLTCFSSPHYTFSFISAISRKKERKKLPSIKVAKIPVSYLTLSSFYSKIYNSPTFADFIFDLSYKSALYFYYYYYRASLLGLVKL